MRFFKLSNLLAFLVLANFGFASAQVTLSANTPYGNAGSGYNFQVLAGSQRQISVHLAGGKTNKVNWSVASSTGGASATLDRGSNTIGVVNVTIGPAAGTCSISGQLGNYAVTSAATVTVQAQSVDDPGKIATFLFNVCANTTSVAIAPAYQQAYKTQPVELQSYVIGNTNEAGTWAITSQPSHGDGALADTDKRDALFSATVPGRYVLTYVSKADPSKNASGTVYISPNAIPSYGLSTKNLTQSTECYADPELKGKVYEVGPGLAYTKINSVPLDTLAAGSIVRIHNMDTTGNSPTTYHETMRIMGTGTPSQPRLFCGVPDSTGHLPIIDAANSTSGTWNNGGTQQYGAISVWGAGRYNGIYSDGSAGPDYLVVSGFEVKNANGDNNFIPSGGGAATPFHTFSSCVNIRSGTYILTAGNDLHDCGNGIFIANNSSGQGYSQVTRFHTIRGNRFRNNGADDDPGKHHIYSGAWYDVIEGNRFENLRGTGGGDAIKDRGLEPIHRYNLIQTQNAGYLVGMESETDSQPYVAFESFLGAAGDTTCHDNPYCSFEKTISADQITAYQEGLEKIFMYGNVYSGRNVALANIKLSDSGGSYGYNWYNQTEMADHLGITYFYNNTVDQPGLAVFGTLSGTNNGSDPLQQFMKPTVFAANNIFYKANTGPVNIFAFARNASFVGIWQTNLMNKGTFDITTPIQGMPSTDLTPVYGWQNYTDQFQYPLDVPIDTHQSGLTAANFLSTPQKNLQPYNAVTYAPVAGAGTGAAGTPITDPVASVLPVRSQYDVELGTIVPRTAPKTLGAIDKGNQPTLISMTPSSSATSMIASLVSPYYTPRPIPLLCAYSDGLTTDCSPQVTFSSSNTSIVFAANSAFVPTLNSGQTSSGFILGTLDGLNTPQIPFGINGAAPPTPTPVKPTIVSVSLSPASVSLMIGATAQFTATAHYSDSTTTACTPTSWASSNLLNATVAGLGVITALVPGSTGVTAVCGGVTSTTSSVTILPAPVIPVPPVPVVPTLTAVSISPKAVTIEIGKTQQLTATALYSDASTQSCAATGWTSTVPTVATVSSSGLLTGLQSGTADITCQCGGVTSSKSTVSIVVTPVKVWSIRPLKTP